MSSFAKDGCRSRSEELRPVSLKLPGQAEVRSAALDHASMGAAWNCSPKGSCAWRTWPFVRAGPGWVNCPTGACSWCLPTAWWCGGRCDGC